MVQIRIIKDYVSGKKGDIKNWDKEGAKNAVEQGIAEYIPNKKKEGILQDSTNKKLLDSIKKEYFFDCEERFEITHTYIKNEETQYSKWKRYPENVSNDEVLKADNRTISPNEIVLDIDQETKEEAQKEYNKIIKKLKKEGYSFKGYFSGSKGFHIHLIFSDLNQYNDYDRKRIKEFFIKKYDCDPMKATNRCMIALENTPHWKTGNKKTLMLEEGNYQNTIIPVLEKMRFKPTIEKTELALEPLDDRFYSADLLNEIHKELDYKHKLDHKEKVASFIIAISSYLKDPNDHCSAAFKGDSSAGKDNIIKTVLDLLPEEDSFMLTRGTQSALEEEANKVRILAFSEMNKHRDKGANSELTEVFKQFCEGGINVIKRDKKTNEVINVKAEQKTSFYGTTETETDEELETRFVILPIKSDSVKNKIVVDDALEKVSNEEYIFKKRESFNWVRNGIRRLDKNINIVIPFAKSFQNKIYDEKDNKEKLLFDFSKERIKRDAKRLLSLTKAITWLYQKQRIIKEIDNEKIIYSEPTDFITAIIIFEEFFNLTYSGLDHRTQKVFEYIKENKGKHTSQILEMKFEMKYSDYVLRHIMQEDLGYESTKTIKKYVDSLKDLGKIETHYDQSVNPRGYLIKEVGSNQGSNRVSLGVSIPAITTHLLAYLPAIKVYDNKELKPIILSFIDDKLVFDDKKREKTARVPQEITTLKITTLKNEIYTQGGTFLKTEKTHSKCSVCGEGGMWFLQKMRGREPICPVCAGYEEPESELRELM